MGMEARDAPNEARGQPWRWWRLGWGTIARSVCNGGGRERGVRSEWQKRRREAEENWIGEEEEEVRREILDRSGG